MRKIKLTKITKKKDEYNVYLGRNHNYKFSQKRKAKKFLGDINTFLNSQLSHLNKSFSEAHQLYRNYYFVIENNDFLRTIKRELENIENSIDLALRRCNSENGSVFTFSHLDNVYNSLISIFTTLYGVASRRKDTPVIYDLNNTLNTLDMFRERFDKIIFEYKKFKIVEEVSLYKIAR